MSHQLSNQERFKFFEEVKNFFKSEVKTLSYLQIRWEDEYQYEDPQDYKDTIKNLAKKYNLDVSNIYLNYRDLSIKIKIKKSPECIAYIKLLKTKVKVYM